MKSLVLILSCILIVSCSTQKAASIEKTDTNIELDNDKWMVMCLSPVNDFRTKLENQIQEELDFHEVHAHTSTQYIPQSLVQNDSTERDVVQLIQSLPSKGYAMLLISRLESVEKTKIDAEGYFGDFTLFHYVTNVYQLDSDDSELVWSMCLYVYEYQLAELSIQDFARVIVGKLAIDQIIPNRKFELTELYTL